MQNTTAQYASLQQYVGERLQQLDPTIDVSPGSPAYTVVIYPLMQRLGTDPLSTDVESFLLQRMADAYPDLDVLSAGSALRDVVVTPIAMFLEPLRREIEYARLNKSLASEDVAAMTLSEVDALLSNLMTGVNTGAFAYGGVRCFFSAQRTVGIDQTVTFSTAAGIQYIPQYASVYLPSDMQRLGNQWYVDVPVQSVNPDTAANVDPDTVKYVTNLPNCTRVTNPAKIEGGFTAQIGTEAVASAERSLTEHSFVSSRAIETTIRASVTGITSIEVVGYGQAGMDRDLLTVDAAPPPEQPGAVVAVTSAFDTGPVIAINGEGSGTPTNLPFTNRIIIHNVDTWSSAQLAAAMTAAFAQVLDGTGGYAPGLLSRVRQIVSKVLQGTDLILTLADFEAYPLEAAPSVGVTRTGANTDRLAFNQYAQQGSSYRLFATDPQFTPGDPDHTYYVGAPLPFTDVAAVGGLPSTAEFGRDYLVLTSVSTGENLAESPDGTSAWKYAAVTRMMPIDSIPASGFVRVARQDAHLLDQTRVPGAYAGTLSDGAPYNARDARVEVVSFGAPSVNADASIQGDGVTVDSWGRNPGVTLTADLTTYATAASTCFVSLSPSYTGTWASMGVKVGHHVALAWQALVMRSDALPVWTAWGRVTDVTGQHLTVEGLDWTALGDLDGTFATHTGAAFSLVGVPNPDAKYILSWTVYTGERALLDGAGQHVTSFDEVAFLPAYLSPTDTSRRVVGRGCSDYRTWASAHHGYTHQHPLASTLMAYGLVDGTTHNAMTASWIRLQRPFDALDPTLGGAPVDLLRGQRVVLLDPSDDVAEGTAIDAYAAPSIAARTAYAQTRLYGTELTLDNDPATAVYAATAPASLPFVAGQVVPIVEAAIVDERVSENPARQSGYLLPYPIRVGSDYRQILQLMAPAAAAPPPLLTLSGIPGGVPFPTAYPGVVSFDGNQVHVGGAVDAHIKPAVSTAGQTLQVLLTPEDLRDTTAVLFTGQDGATDSGSPDTFFSTSLVAFLQSLYPGVDMSVDSAALDDLCVEVIDRPSTALITPAAFRITHNIVGTAGVGADASFSSTFSDVRFRLLRRIDVEVTAPVQVVQQGVDLQTYGGAPTVRIPSGITFLEDPNSVSLFVQIGVAPRQTEYQVVQVGVNTLQLTSAPPVSLVGQPYRVYRKQSSVASNPVVRLSSVQLGTAGTGTAVPYRHPVGNYLVSMASLNDDPLGHTEFGDLTTGTSAGLATLQSVNSFTAVGVTEYDVVVLPDAPEGDRYFWIRAITGTGPYVLHLDRPFVAVQNGAIIANYQVGHPAVGAMRCYFLDPTLFSVGQDCSFQHVAGDGTKSWYRPSPAESTQVYGPTAHTTDTQLALVGGAHFLVSLTQNFLADGVRAGDTVEIVSRVLRTATFEVGNTTDPLVAGVAGHRLAIAVAGQQYSVLFGGSGMVSLDSIATDIRRRLGTLVQVDLPAVTGPSGFQLTISSYWPVSILATNSSALLNALGLQVGENDSGGAVGLSIPILSTTHVPGEYRIHLSEQDVAGNTVSYTALEAQNVFFRVNRLEVQTVFPAGMTPAGKLWSADIKVTSFAPRNSATVQPTDGLDIMGNYTSYGYEVASRNASYSYSPRDQVVLRVTPLVPPVDAANMSDLVCALGSPVTVTYETAPEVVSAQQLMMRTDIRNATSDPLARHFFPAYPAMDLSYVGTVDTATMQAALTTLFVGLYPNKTLVSSDVIGAMLKSGATTVRGPVLVGYLVMGADRRYRLLLSPDLVTLPAGYHVMGELDYVQINGGA